MTETKLKIDGMMCGMCESHINDAIRRAFNVAQQGRDGRALGGAAG